MRNSTCHANLFTFNDWILLWFFLGNGLQFSLPSPTFPDLIAKVMQSVIFLPHSLVGTGASMHKRWASLTLWQQWSSWVQNCLREPLLDFIKILVWYLQLLQINFFSIGRWFDRKSPLQEQKRASKYCHQIWKATVLRSESVRWLATSPHPTHEYGSFLWTLHLVVSGESEWGIWDCQEPMFRPSLWRAVERYGAIQRSFSTCPVPWWQHLDLPAFMKIEDHLY